MNSKTIKVARSGILRVLPLVPILLVISFLFALGEASDSGEQRSASDETAEDVYYRANGPVSGPPAPKLTKSDYPDSGLSSIFAESRIVIWILAQQHLYLANFVIGGIFLVLLFEFMGIVGRGKSASDQYDLMGHTVLGLIFRAVNLTVVLGGLLAIGLYSLYPGFFGYLVSIFKPLVQIFAVLFLFLVGTVSLWYYTWGRMESGNWKWVHASLGLIAANLVLAMMSIGNSWSTFMVSPAGVDAQGRFLGSYWNVLHNHLWNPLNVHRFFASLIFGSAVISAYAVYECLTAKSQEDREFFDRMAHLCFLILILALLTIPFGGYWLSREIYSYRQQMGITLLGGQLAWFNVEIVMLMSGLFLAGNYYIWQRIGCNPNGAQYRCYGKYVYLLLAVCTLVYITPHTAVITERELVAIGDRWHPVLRNFSVESAKQAAVNLMMITTIWSFLLLRRCRYEPEDTSHIIRDSMLAGLFIAGGANILWLSIYGYYIPANVRVGLSVPVVMTTLSIIIFGFLLNSKLFHRSKAALSQTWGNLPVRGYFAILFIAVSVTLVMGVGGYMRSSVRLFWHATEIIRDNSPWAFTHPIGFAANVISMNALIFWLGFVLLVAMTRLSKSQSAHLKKESSSLVKTKA